MKNVVKATIAAIALLQVAGMAQAQDAKWWPFDVYKAGDEQRNLIPYEPRTEKASKPWNVCVLIPHMKDSYWIAVDYGLVTEARRQGIKLTILQAGGYDQLPKQLSQFDNCMASKADAIITAAISESGFGEKFKEGIAAGVPQIAALNPIFDVPVTAQIVAENMALSTEVGRVIAKQAGDTPTRALAFPGPQGSGWAEKSLEGFKAGIAGTSVELVDAKFGDTGVDVQRKLVEDALQAYDNINVIFGTSPTAEAAVGALQEAGLSDSVKVFGAYDNLAELELLKQGKVAGFGVLYPVAQARIAVDLAVRSLEGELTDPDIRVAPGVLTQEGLATFPLDQAFPPESWKPVYSVD